MKTSEARKRYEKLSPLRDRFVINAKEAAKLTIPSLFPETKSSKANLPSPWNGLGARGVNNLASKLILALFPPTQTFFNLSVNEDILNQLLKNTNADPASVRAEIESSLSRVEQVTLHAMEADGFRSGMFEAMRYLIVSGNSLIYLPKTGGVKVFRLDSYVVERDAAGNPLEIVVKETIAISALPSEIRDHVKNKATSRRGESVKDTDEVDIYTHVVLKDDKWQVHQCVEDEEIPDSDGSYNKDECPYVPLRFVRVSGEAYGRGYVEEFIGDLRSLNSLTRSIVIGSQEAAKVYWMIRPGALVRPRDFQQDTGRTMYGRGDDVSTIVSGKQGDFQIALQTVQRIEERLSFAFLLASPRDAERVTAQEIRLLAGMLEDALGGIYSVLAGEAQRPIVRRYLTILERSKKLPALPMKYLDLRIVTGVEALGRGHELQRLDSFLQGVAQTLGPESLQDYIKPEVYLSKRAAALGVDRNLVRSAEEVAKIQQQRAQQAMAQQAVGPAINQIGGMAQQQVANQQQQ